MALSPKSSSKSSSKNIKQEPEQTKRIAKSNAFIYADTYLPGSSGLQKLVQNIGSDIKKTDAIFLEGIEKDLSVAFSEKGDCLWGAGLWRAQTQGEEVSTLSVGELIENFLSSGKKKIADSKTAEKKDKKDKNADKLPELRLKSFLQTFTNCISHHDNAHLIQNLSGTDNKIAGIPRWEMYFDLFNNAKKAGVAVELLDIPFVPDDYQPDVDSAASTIASWCYEKPAVDPQKEGKNTKKTTSTEPRQAHILLGLPLCQRIKLALLQNNLEPIIFAEDEWGSSKIAKNNLIETTLRSGYEALYSVDPDNLKESASF
jgi:hypothetical protein